MANQNSPVYIVSGARTPIGAFLGSLGALAAPVLGSVALAGALKRGHQNSEALKAALDEVIMGCVLSAGIGQAPARQALRKAGIPDSVGATTVNKVCGSGMKAVMLAAQAIQAGDASLILAGGMESMSQVPYYNKTERQGARMGHQQLIDGMIYDGLWDPYNNIHMGSCAEQCVAKYGFTREAQDAFARSSYERARAAVESGAFAAEIEPVPVPQRKGDPNWIDRDEQPFKDDIDKLTTLRPAFQKENGTITAGNASTINDGAAALLLASEAAVQEHGLKPLARIVGSATHSQDPVWFTTAPVGAMQKLLAKLDLTAGDVDLFEINEAFAAVAMAAEKDLGLPHEKVNVRGGAVALGHPIGASGARLLVTLLYALKDLNLKQGMASLCIGGGEATAMLIERCD